LLPPGSAGFSITIDVSQTQPSRFVVTAGYLGAAVESLPASVPEIDPAVTPPATMPGHGVNKGVTPPDPLEGPLEDLRAAIEQADNNLQKANALLDNSDLVTQLGRDGARAALQAAQKALEAGQAKITSLVTTIGASIGKIPDLYRADAGSALIKAANLVPGLDSSIRALVNRHDFLATRIDG
jgi:hypothetical protein